MRLKHDIAERAGLAWWTQAGHGVVTGMLTVTAIAGVLVTAQHHNVAKVALKQKQSTLH